MTDQMSDNLSWSGSYYPDLNPRQRDRLRWRHLPSRLRRILQRAGELLERADEGSILEGLGGGRGNLVLGHDGAQEAGNGEQGRDEAHR